MSRRLLPSLLVLVLLGATLAVGCSSRSGGPPAFSESARDQLVVLPALSEIVAGAQRLTFGMFNADGEQLQAPEVGVQLYQLQGERDVPKWQYRAAYFRVQIDTPHVHEGGLVHAHVEVRGIYLVEKATFDGTGVWRAEATLTARDGKTRKGSMALQVVERSSTPALGEAVPASNHPTARDVPNLEELTTRTPPEPLFHQVSIAQALRARRPFVVVFATPAFCVSRMCGPVLEVVHAVALEVGDKADFIQIEPYDLKLARGEGKLQLVPAAREWGLQSEPWVFVVDAQGRVAAKFEGPLAPQELLAAVRKATG